MAWQDRQYNRDRGGSTGNPLMWLLSGSLPLFTAFGIRVRAHASLIVFIALVLLFGFGKGFSIEDRFESMAVLFCVILLHEFGHCFAARWVGGEAEDILMHPLGGLAFARPPRRPLPTFITVAGGPAVNVLICVVTGLVFRTLTGVLPWNPFAWMNLGERHALSWESVISWSYWIYFVSYLNLLFNLLPIFPLDGGQMLQSILWPKFGYYKSMLFSCKVGLIGATALGIFALYSGNILLLCVVIMGFSYCLQLRRQLLAEGPYVEYDEPDYGLKVAAAATRRRRRIGRWAMRRARQRAMADQAEQQHIDAILAKVSAHGMHSLTWFERRALRKATEHQRERDLEISGERPSE